MAGRRRRGPALPDSLRAQRPDLLRDRGLPGAAQRHARHRLEHHRRLGGPVRLRAQHLLRDRRLHRGAAVHPSRLERLARPARRGGRLGGALRRAHLPGHAAARPLLRDRHRGDVDDRAAHRRHLAVHQRQPGPLHPGGRRRQLRARHAHDGVPRARQGARLLLPVAPALRGHAAPAPARSSARSSASTSARCATTRTAPRPSASTAGSTR